MLALQHLLPLSVLLMGIDSYLIYPTSTQPFFHLIYDLTLFIYIFIYVASAEFAFNPKEIKLSKKGSSPNSSGKLTETEIREKIKRISRTLEDKVFLLFSIGILVLK